MEGAALRTGQSAVKLGLTPYTTWHMLENSLKFNISLITYMGGV